MAVITGPSYPHEIINLVVRVKGHIFIRQEIQNYVLCVIFSHLVFSLLIIISLAHKRKSETNSFFLGVHLLCADGFLLGLLWILLCYDKWWVEIWDTSCSWCLVGRMVFVCSEYWHACIGIRWFWVNYLSCLSREEMLLSSSLVVCYCYLIYFICTAGLHLNVVFILYYDYDDVIPCEWVYTCFYIWRRKLICVVEQKGSHWKDNDTFHLLMYYLCLCVSGCAIIIKSTLEQQPLLLS